MKEKKFKKHFRIHFRNGHPAYIVDEDGNTCVFHRVTHSKTSGGRNNIKIDNPLVKGVDTDNLLIKKAGGSQPVGTNNITTSTIIKPKVKKKGKKNG